MWKAEDLCKILIDAAKNHGIYLGGANGEKTMKLRIEDICRFENNYEGRDHKSDIYRVLCHIANCIKAGYNMDESIAADCSGLLVYALRLLGIITTEDYRCRDFQKMSKPVSLSEIKPADIVFNKVSESTHMAVYVGNGDIVESRGRDFGIVCRKLSSAPEFIIGGRLDWFSEDIPVLTRELRYVENDLMHGADVRQCQERLIKKGFNPGLADSYYGRKTEEAVKNFQISSELNIRRLGVVGQKTWRKLWED